MVRTRWSRRRSGVCVPFRTRAQIDGLSALGRYPMALLQGSKSAGKFGWGPHVPQETIGAALMRGAPGLATVAR